ncbi:proteoglycan 4-like [Oncorhynchus mykiss]|uniref:proteoglycan 4-like n=1 Tax=Oncorhynchus mykiss TaxID=8022 RepID=UPI0018776ABC|nr:proteoglycan 4-like [Oncorhynchus mykiss]
MDGENKPCLPLSFTVPKSEGPDCNSKVQSEQQAPEMASVKQEDCSQTLGLNVNIKDEVKEEEIETFVYHGPAGGFKEETEEHKVLLLKGLSQGEISSSGPPPTPEGTVESALPPWRSYPPPHHQHLGQHQQCHPNPSPPVLHHLTPSTLALLSNPSPPVLLHLTPSTLALLSNPSRPVLHHLTPSTLALLSNPSRLAGHHRAPKSICSNKSWTHRICASATLPLGTPSASMSSPLTLISPTAPHFDSPFPLPVITTHSPQPSQTSPAPTSPTLTSPAPTSPTLTSPAPTSPTLTSPAPTSPTLTSPAPTSPTLTSPAPTSPTLTSPAPTSPTLTSPAPTLTSPAPTSPTLTSPAPTSPTLTSPAPTSPTLTSPAPTSPTLTSPAPTSPTLTSPSPTSPTLTSPAPTSPTLTSPAPTSATLTSPAPTSATLTSPAHSLIPPISRSVKRRVQETVRPCPTPTAKNQKHQQTSRNKCK